MQLFNRRSPLTGSAAIRTEWSRVDFSCTVVIFHPQVCARSLNSGLIVPMRLSFLTRREPLSCFSWEGGVNFFVAFVVLDPRENSGGGRWLKSSEQHG